MNLDHDVIIVGAGFSGLYSVHKLRDELGLRVQAFEAAGGLGGTWWWNRYPGARCDIESIYYSYSFSDDIQKKWQWSEKYASQPEILAYMEFVADELDLRRSFQFNTRVTGAKWNDKSKCWHVSTDDGGSYTARFLIAATGVLSVPKQPDIAGLDSFGGKVYLTAAWPAEPVDFAGKRVGIIGTGSTGIQVIQEVAKTAAHLTVFQRTPNYVMPLRNEPVEPEQRAWLAERHAEVRGDQRNTLAGMRIEWPRPTFRMDTLEQRQGLYEDLWQRGGFSTVSSAYADLLFDQEANDDHATFVRDKIRQQVKNSRKAELLVPFDHPLMSKRPAFGDTYYQALSEDNVEVIDVRATPVVRMSQTGLVTANAEYPLDILIFATGFDAMTGPFLKLGLEGRDGATLTEYWKQGPCTFLGVAMHGFPNLFMVLGPPPAIYNNVSMIEDHVNFAARAIKHTLQAGAQVIEASAEADRRSTQLAEHLFSMSLIPGSNSWFAGANVEGKARAAYITLLIGPVYLAFLRDVEMNGFGGFEFDGRAQMLPPLMKLDPSAIALLSMQVIARTKPQDQQSLEELRQSLEQLVMLQGPPRDVKVIETSYVSAAENRQVRIYIPHGERLSRPALVFFHGGGFVAGSLNAADCPCRALADDLGAVVISASYRLAPEHPFPAAVDDALAAVRWAATVAGQFGGAVNQLFVSGESAGAQLAAVVAQRIRDEGGPTLAGQILIQPVIDAEADTPSKTEFADSPFLKLSAGRKFWTAYLGDPAANFSSPLASPGRARSLAGLPPALVLTGECDMLRDEGEEYGRKMRAAGVPVTIHRLAGLPHAVFSLGGVIPRGRELTDAIVQFVNATLPNVPAARLEAASG